MNFRFLSLGCLSFVALVARPASAGVPWEDMDRFFKARCTENLNGSFKTQISCEMDHASFEKGKHGPNDVVPSDPNAYDLCGTAALFSISTPNIVVHCADDSVCGPKFKKAVKKVVCVFGDANQLTLSNNTLVIHVNPQAGDSSDSWTHSELSKLFGFKEK